MVSDRKRDVVDMLKHFNIKIDNPLVFMEQTTMKQFIQGRREDQIQTSHAGAELPFPGAELHRNGGQSPQYERDAEAVQGRGAGQEGARRETRRRTS